MEAIGIDCGALGRAVALITEIFSRRRYLNYHTEYSMKDVSECIAPLVKQIGYCLNCFFKWAMTGL